MGHSKFIKYKYDGNKLVITTYNPHVGVCPKCGDEGYKSPRESVKRLNGEIVQRYTCNGCNYSGAGDKFGLSRELTKPLKVEIIEGIGVCPSCKSENVAFPSGSQSHYSSTHEKFVIYKQMKCRSCGYKGRDKMFGVMK